MSRPRGRPKKVISEKKVLEMNKYAIVYDTTAKRGQKRTHDIYVSEDELVPYELSSSEGTKMPLSHAASFLKDDAFKVLDEDGERIVLPKFKRIEDVKVLDPEEVIARLSELTTEALSLRCSITPGDGFDVSQSGSRDQMIEFLIGSSESRTPERVEVPENASALLEDWEDEGSVDDSLDNILSQVNS